MVAGICATAIMVIYGSESGLETLFRATTAVGTIVGPLLILYFQKKMGMDQAKITKSHMKELEMLLKQIKEQTK